MNVRNKREYVQMPFQVFIEQCPEALELFPVELRPMLLSDDKYLVRLSDDGKIEIGYESDKWAIS